MPLHLLHPHLSIYPPVAFTPTFQYFSLPTTSCCILSYPPQQCLLCPLLCSFFFFLSKISVSLLVQPSKHIQSPLLSHRPCHKTLSEGDKWKVIPAMIILFGHRPLTWSLVTVTLIVLGTFPLCDRVCLLSSVLLKLQPCKVIAVFMCWWI